MAVQRPAMPAPTMITWRGMLKGAEKKGGDGDSESKGKVMR
jgi:hypothetical protein